VALEALDVKKYENMAVRESQTIKNAKCSGAMKLSKHWISIAEAKPTAGS
jgi:hypothetical protein